MPGCIVNVVGEDATIALGVILICMSFLIIYHVVRSVFRLWGERAVHP